MKQLAISFLLILFTLMGRDQIAISQAMKSSNSKCDPLINERLSDYFERSQEKPAQIINNVDNPGLRESKTKTIKIGNHTVEWIDKVGLRDRESSVKINGDLILLKDKKSVNSADGSETLELNFVGRWDQIKLYQLYNQEIIGIAMSAEMCTGLMCSVGAELLYDVKTKAKTFFGTFRVNSEVKLFRFPNEEAYYYVSKNFSGDPHTETSPAVVTYELRRLDSDGTFQIQKKPKSGNYFIKHTTFPAKEQKIDSLEQNWIEKFDQSG